VVARSIEPDIAIVPVLVKVVLLVDTVKSKQSKAPVKVTV
jgi:hypothetical protein